MVGLKVEPYKLNFNGHMFILAGNSERKPEFFVFLRWKPELGNISNFEKKSEKDQI